MSEPFLEVRLPCLRQKTYGPGALDRWAGRTGGLSFGLTSGYQLSTYQTTGAWSLEKDFGGGGYGLSPGVFRNSWLTVIETLFRVYLGETSCLNPIPPRTAWVKSLVFLSLCFPICEMERILAAGWLSQPLWSLKHHRTPRCDVPCSSEHLSQAEVRQDCRAPQASARLSHNAKVFVSLLCSLSGGAAPSQTSLPSPPPRTFSRTDCGSS